MTQGKPTMKPSILHIITGLQDGGAEAVLYRISTYDAGSRHHVVSLMDEGKYGPLLAAKGVRVTCLNMPRGRVTAGGILRLARLIRRERPDVVQTWMYHGDLVGGIAARLAGHLNIIWGIRNTILAPGESTRGTILVARVCALVSRWVPRRIICCAEKAREVHVALGYDAGRMIVVPNGYDLSLFRPDARSGEAVRRELGLGPDAPVIGFVARFDPVKDHPTLLRALALLPAGQRPVCLLVGSGMDEANTPVTGLIETLGLRDHVRLLGRRADIPAVMNALDAHVLSSSSEAFPNAVAEAMACGTPCIATDVGDAAAIVGDTGWLVPPRDPQALSGAMAAALAERGTAAGRARGEAARNRMETNFTIDRMIERYHAVWHT